MFKNFMLKWWGVAILSVIYLYVIELFNEYVISREMMEELQIVFTLGVLVYTYHTVKLTHNFIYNNLKEKQND
jgi:hypothetical protein